MLTISSTTRKTRTYTPNTLKKLLVVCGVFCGVFFFFSLLTYVHFTYAQQDPRFNESFISKLKANHIDISSLETKTTISRYELARLLNLVECRDCLDPGIKMKQKYTQAFWSEFTALPGKDFRDIAFEQAFSKDDPTKSYYYCVAYVGDNEYMRGYPIATSPICRGNFCGDKAVTKAEFIQVIINIVEKYIYKNYKANRTEIKKRADSLAPDEYAARTLTQEDRNTIAIASKKCQGTACPLQSRYEFETYLKYCMFHLDACNFRPFGWIKQNYWPVAELNIMLKEGLIPLGDTPEKDIHKPIDGTYVLQVIGELHKKIDCSFDPDYDCDGVPNRQDNCKNDYNPQQRDRDNDGIGNVCDDDIDNGGQKHPKGIVDDNDTISIGVLQQAKEPIENDLFDKTDDGDDATKNNQAAKQKAISLDIKIQNVSPNEEQKNKPNASQYASYSFVLSIQGLGESPDSIEWDLGDGTKKVLSGQRLSVTNTQTASEVSLSHSYKPGTYIVTAVVTKGSQKALAKTTLLVPQIPPKTIPLGIKVSPTVTTYPATIQGTALLASGSAQGEPYKLTRYFNGQPVGNTEIVSFLLTGPTLATLTAKMHDTQGTLKSIAQATYEASLTFGRSSQIVATNLMPQPREKVTIQTIPGGWTAKDIASIAWYLGEAIPKVNKDLTQTVSFQTPGTKVITQTITFLDGTQHTNYLTLYVLGHDNHPPVYLSFTSPEKVKYTNTEMPFMLEVANVHPDEILKAVVDRNDGSTEEIQKHRRQQTPHSNVLQVNLTHTYSQGGKKNPTLTLYLKNCRTIYGQLTVYSIDQKNCYAAYLRNMLKDTYRCDMDQDGIPDMCDDDIDGDGKKNLLGLITSENPDCSIMLENEDLKKGGNEGSPNEKDDGTKQKGGQNAGVKNNNVNPSILAQTIRGCTLDPCPFTKNTTCQRIADLVDGMEPQKSKKPGEEAKKEPKNEARAPSSNTNSSSNNEDGTNAEDADKDKDGIPDKIDMCPLLPETYNERNDEDGCPEFGEENPCFAQETRPEVPIVPTNCNTCPCHFADIGGELLRSDILRAVLMNTGGTMQYSRSFGQKRTK